MKKQYITVAKQLVFSLVLFTLPMYMRLNNVLLLVFFGLFLLEGNFLEKWSYLKSRKWQLISIASLFLLAVLAAINHPEKDVFRYLERYWSFLAIPVVIVSSKEYHGAAAKRVFMPLVLGCVATLLICYGNVIYEMVTKNEPLHYFLRHRHLNHEFTEVADTHPAYLGIFMVASAAFLYFESKIRIAWKIIILGFFCFGFIQLASRMAIVCFGLVTLLFLITKVRKHWKLFAIASGIGLVCLSLLYVSSSEFLKERLISKKRLNNDERFSRNIVSWELFKEYPLFGVGFGRKDVLREQKYCVYGFQVAAENQYNAHNQYLEYLSVNGVLGGLVFLWVMIYFIYLGWQHRSLYFLLLLVTFFLANTTESMLVRIKGIEYFSILLALVVASTIKEKPENSTNLD